jgi:predicted HD superfamily hydrolase involved in NAD metabolism
MRVAISLQYLEGPTIIYSLSYPITHTPTPSVQEITDLLLAYPSSLDFYLDPGFLESLVPWQERVRLMVKPRRFQHILRVAHLSYFIAQANGIDPERAFTAGLLHDVARDLSGSELLRLAPPECDLDAQHPLAVHGRAARVLLERWGYDDQQVLEAVEDHTTGPRANNPFSKVVYVADVSEPGRGVNAGIRELAFDDLEAALHLAICSKVDYLQGRGIRVHPRTLEVHGWICLPCTASSEKRA